MKKIIILIIIFFLQSNLCKSQIYDTVHFYDTSSFYNLTKDYIRYFKDEGFYHSIINITDTNKVFMLCADTSFKKGNLEFSIYRNTEDSTQNTATVKNRIPYCFWLFGYSVRKNMWTEYYLDENKQKLSKNIFVILSTSY